MALHLREINGAIARSGAALGEEDYVLLPGHPAFEWFWHVYLSVAAMTSAVSQDKNRHVPEGSYIGVSCLALDYTFRIPAGQSVGFALGNELPAELPVTIHWGKKPGQHLNWAAPLQTWLKNVIWPGFLTFMEENENRIQDRSFRDIAVAIRNAYAHKKTIEWPDQRPARSWHGLTFDQSLRGRHVHDVIGYSDVMALMLLIANEPSNRK